MDHHRLTTVTATVTATATVGDLLQDVGNAVIIKTETTEALRWIEEANLSEASTITAIIGTGVGPKVPEVIEIVVGAAAIVRTVLFRNTV